MFIFSCLCTDYVIELQNVEYVECHPLKIWNYNFHPLKSVSRYRDPQLQAGKNDLHRVQFETKYRPVYSKFNPYSAGIDFSRQNLTSVDVRF